MMRPPPRTYNIHEAKTQLSKLLAQVAHGDEVLISRAGVPVARLVPIAPNPTARVLGTEAGRLVVADDFDAPLPPELLASFAR